MIWYGKEPWPIEINGDECWECNGIGYKGFDYVYEDTMPVSDEIRNLKFEDGPVEVELVVKR